MSSEMSRQASGEAGRLLVVDDEGSIARAISSYFTAIGFVVTSARNVAEAEDMLSRGCFDTVITDLRIDTPKDGLRVASRALEACPGARVVVLTGFGTPDVEAEAMRLGVHAFLHKPLPLATIAAVVRSPRA